MNTDTSDFVLQSDQYRYAENVRIITNTESNTGELRLIEGTTKKFKFGDGCQILATNYIRNIAVFVVKEGNWWYIYKSEDDGDPDCIFGPCKEPLWNGSEENILKSITTVLRYESDKNIKLYIADSTKKHSILIINVANKYNEAQSDFDYMFANQRTLLAPPEIEVSASSGKIISGKVQYAYRLYSKNGATTPMSILSKTLSLYKNEYQGYEAEKQSGRAVKITIPAARPSNLDYIQVYRISYQLSGQLPKISLVKDQKLFDSIIDNGVDVEDDIAISEFLQQFTPHIYPTQIESKGDYLFAANMKYSQDAVDSKFENFDARCYSRGNYIVKNENTQNEIRQDVLQSDKIILDVDNETLRHWAFNVREYEYLEDDWHGFILNQNGGISDYQSYENEDPINGYGKCLCWRYSYDRIYTDGNKRYPTPSDQSGSVINQKSTFRSGETYRFGIRLFDEYGNASSVKWIADIMIPIGANMQYDFEQEETIFRNVGIEFFKTPGSDSYWENVSSFEIVRCERTLEDRKAITQGIIGFPVELYNTVGTNNTTTNLLCTPGFFSKEMTLFQDLGQASKFASTCNSIIMFSSPEYCYQQDDIEDILKAFKSQTYIKEVYSCYPQSSAITENHATLDSGGQEQPIEFYSTNNTSLAYPFNSIQGNYSRYHSFNIWHCFVGRDYTGSDFMGVTTKYAESETRWYLNYFKPDYSRFTDIESSKYDINSISFAKAPKYSDFANQEMLTFKDNISSIDNKSFVNWSAPLILDIGGQDESVLKAWIDDNTDNPSTGYDNGADPGNRTFYPIGAGGKTILLKLENNQTIPTKDSSNAAPSITIANINKKGIVPYKGYNKTAIDNSTYISLGDYKKYSKNDNCSISVFSGDTKNRCFTYHALHNWYDSTYKNLSKMGTVYAVPVETDIDIQAQYGQLYGVDNFLDYRIQDEPASFESYTQEHSAYLYNPAYNSTPDIVSWTTAEQLKSKFDTFDVRIHYSNVKVNNEDIDSWTQFAAANYIDVDSRFGEITDLKLFKDKLIFWQENATGILAVNERVVLNDQNDTQVVLGTGGVLERYDYFSTVYGQKKNQHARTMSNDSLYWWDGNNKEIMLYQQRYDVTPLSTQKSIKNYINSYEECEVPFLSYDNKYKEVIANVIDSDKSIIYNEQAQQFTSVYTFSPIFDFVLNGKLFLTSGDTLYNYNTCEQSQSKLFDNEAHPLVKYVVNKDPMYVKTFDIQTFGGRFYGGEMEDLKDLILDYYTPLKQHSSVSCGENIDDKRRMTNVEYDFRINIPRNGSDSNNKKVYGDRMKGKTMQCEFKSDSNNTDFSLQYIITKFRMSWT